MFITPFAQKVVSAALAGFFIAAGIITFGDASKFDRLYIAIIIAIAVYVRKDVNLLGVIFILAFERVVEELVWLTTFGDNGFKWIVYLVCALGLCHERKAKAPCFFYLTLIYLLTVSSELYWLATGYNAPQIYWYLFLVANTVFIRNLFILRPFRTAEYFPSEAEPLRIDHHLHNIFAFFIWINIAMIVEYLLRHLVGLNHVLYVYNSFEYIVHIIATAILFNLTDQSIKVANKRLIKV